MSDLSLGWIDICRTRGATVIVDYSPEWEEFLDASELHFEDMFACDPPVLSPGLYRWTGFTPGSWDEGDLISIKGGSFESRTHGEALEAAEARAWELTAESKHLAESLTEISDMLMSRPDMVRAMQPLIGWAEKAVMARAAGTLQGYKSRLALQDGEGGAL